MDREQVINISLISTLVSALTSSYMYARCGLFAVYDVKRIEKSVICPVYNFNFYNKVIILFLQAVLVCVRWLRLEHPFAAEKCYI